LELLILLQTPTSTDQTTTKENENIILNIPYTQTLTSSKTVISYTPIDSAPALLPHGSPLPASNRAAIPITSDSIDQYTRHIFEGRFTPLKMIVNGRKGRRVIVVLGADRKHYRVLDMDYYKGGGRVGDEEDGEAEDGEDAEGDTEMDGA
jgi:anaphase-promoting complex subunit 4